MPKPRTTPAKPSADTDRVWRWLQDAASRYPDVSVDALLRMLAAEIVRRSPDFVDCLPPEEPT